MAAPSIRAYQPAVPKLEKILILERRAAKTARHDHTHHYPQA
jgi:hypothetical protein